MRSSTSIKIAAMVLLGVFTSSMTTAILAQYPRSSRRAAAREGVGKPANAEPAVQPQSSTVPSVAHDDLDQAADVDGMKPRWIAAAATLGHMDVRSLGRRVIVSASANIQDDRPGIPYFWSLRVYGASAEGDPLSERHYLEQMFTPPMGSVMKPTFEESFDLDPGSYHVEVVLYRFNRNFHWKDLKDEQKKKAHRAVSGIGKIAIAF